MRIVSLCPSNTELLAYLGFTDRIVGVDNFSDWPEQVKELPQLGPDLSIDVDAVEELKPDLVVASLSVPGMERNIETLEERQLPHIVLNPHSLADIGGNLLAVGEALDCMEQAERVYAQYHRVLDRFREWSREAGSRPTIYWEWWAKPVFTPGGSNWLTEISELAGGRNLLAEASESSVKTTWEDIRERHPDVICLAWVGVRQELVKPEIVKKRPGWSELPAVAEGRLYVMEEPLYCRPSPRLLVGLSKLAYLLHPDIYPAPHEDDGKDLSIMNI